MIVSFDFDGTLDTPKIKEYAKELMSRGYDVHITTQRPPTLFKDVFEVANSIGVKLENIHFCGIQSKQYVLEEVDYIFHLDNSDEACSTIPRAIFLDDNFRNNCEDALMRV